MPKLPSVAELVKKNERYDYWHIINRVLLIADDLGTLGCSFVNISLHDIMYDVNKDKVYVGSPGLIQKNLFGLTRPTHLFDELLILERRYIKQYQDPKKDLEKDQKCPGCHTQFPSWSLSKMYEK